MQIVRKMVLNKTECMVEMEFDEETTLRYLADVAFRNRTKKTKYGPVTVRVRPTLASRKQAALAAINEFVAEES